RRLSPASERQTPLAPVSRRLAEVVSVRARRPPASQRRHPSAMFRSAKRPPRSFRLLVLKWALQAPFLHEAPLLVRRIQPKAQALQSAQMVVLLLGRVVKVAEA